MGKFATQYRELFARFGYPLGKSHAVARSTLKRAEERLDVSIPNSLRDYYLVAGNERRFNRSLQTFLAPSKWFVDGKRLAFMRENQAVCCWGVSLRSKGAKDPSIWQGMDHVDSLSWHKEHDYCSTFISVMLHYQAVSGGYAHCGSAEAPKDLRERLATDWQYAGEVNGLAAASRQNQVLCVMPGSGLPFMPAAMILAGAKTAGELERLRDELGVTFT